jgi:nucleoside-diphosphate-sugar epimerase
VYGDVSDPIGDDQPPLSRHWMPYARAKAASEVWLRSRAGQEGVEIIVLRPGIVWGVGSPHTMHFARSLAAKSGFLVGDGSGIFNGVYIDNLTSCIRVCADHTKSAPGFYNVGDRETITWREFFDALGPALDCDPARLPAVSGDRFPWSIGAGIDAVQSLGAVNALYHRLKTHIPDGLKATIRARLEGNYRYERHAAAYAVDASVDREQWHLQRVRHKLPTGKFDRTFQYSVPVTFQDGMRRTLTWLASLGMVSPSYPPLRD